MSKYYNLKKLNPDKKYHFILESKIEKIDKILYDSYVSDYGIGKTNYNYIMEFIKNQQKEIENLANGIRVLGTNPSITTEEIIEEFRKNPISKEYLEKFRKDYIHKDKIREILNKYIDIDEHLKYTNCELWEKIYQI